MIHILLVCSKIFHVSSQCKDFIGLIAISKTRFWEHFYFLNFEPRFLWRGRFSFLEHRSSFWLLFRYPQTWSKQLWPSHQVSSEERNYCCELLMELQNADFSNTWAWFILIMCEDFDWYLGGYCVEIRKYHESVFEITSQRSLAYS